MGKVTGSDKVAEWTSRLARWESSRLSVARFSEQEGVSTASVYLWRKKLARGNGRRRFLAASVTSPLRRVELRSVSTMQQAVIRLPAGITIELGSDPQVASGIVESLVR